MAVSKIKAIKAKGGKSAKKTVRNFIGYILLAKKTDNGALVANFNLANGCDAATDAVMLNRELYLMNCTKPIDKEKERLMYHVIQSFDKSDNLSPVEALDIAIELADELTKRQHGYIATAHIDKEQLHIHIGFDAVNINADGKYKDIKNSAFHLQKISDEICLKYGLSIIDDPKVQDRIAQKTKTHQNSEKILTKREALHKEIEAIFAEHSPKHMDELLKHLEGLGYSISSRGQNYSLIKEGWAQPIRLFSNRPGEKEHYGKEAILNKLSENKIVHIYQSQEGRPTIGRLFDLSSDKFMARSYYYRQWARLENIKNLSKTINFLKATDINLLYSEIASLRKEVEPYKERQQDIKEAQRQLSQYIRTRPIFQEYKNLGYNQEFYEANKNAIEAYNQAREYLAKLAEEAYDGHFPKYQSLKEEYAKIQKEIYEIEREAKKLENIKENAEKAFTSDISRENKELHYDKER